MNQREIPLSNGGVALIDADDYDNLMQRKWHRNTCGYATTDMRLGGKRIHLAMHRVVMKAPDGVEVDHINRDRTDNRKFNLRFCTRAENIRNTSRACKPVSDERHRAEREKLTAILQSSAPVEHDLSHHYTKPPQTKLTPRDVLQVRYLRLVAGTRTNDIAARYGTNRSTINRIVSGKLWPELPTDVAAITAALAARKP